MKVEKEIDDVRMKISTIESQIKSKRKEAEKIRRANIRELKSTLEKDKLHRMKKQREVIQSINNEIADLTHIRDNMLNRLEELKLAKIYEGQVVVYRSNEERFFTLVNKAKEELVNLNKQILSFKKTVEELRPMKLPAETLRGLVRELKDKVSLPTFFETGEVVSDLGDNDKWIKEVEQRYHTLLEDLPVLGESINRLRESLRIRLNTSVDLVKDLRKERSSV